jgi:hypothetical protein
MPSWWQEKQKMHCNPPIRLAKEIQMTINEAEFENERELQEWVFSDIRRFLADSHLVNGFQIGTVSGKHGVPDGFAFSIPNREWYLVECELLSHGVWPHIAEQITRFIVALQNPETMRKVRDRFFEYVLEQQIGSEIVASLGTLPERLHQQLELFLETIEPKVVIFIDETNRDLSDMAQALNTPVSIFRIKKFIVDGKAEYYSPDITAPVIEIEPGEEGPRVAYDIVELLGGGKLEASIRRFKCYSLADGTVVTIKKSRLYPDYGAYWYGISTSSLEHTKEHGVSHMVFIMGNFGFVKVPMALVEEFLKHTLTSKNPDGSVRHYHLYISHDPAPELYITNDLPKYALAEYFQGFD